MKYYVLDGCDAEGCTCSMLEVPEERGEWVKKEAFVEARREIEQLRVQLAGCGVAAMQNTLESAKERAKEGDYGWSQSYADVCVAVDREIDLRKRLAEAEKANARLVRCLEASYER